MNFITIDLGSVLARLHKTAAERPGRLFTVFSTAFLFACGAALVFPGSRIPFVVTAVVALAAAIAVGSMAASRGESERLEPQADDGGPVPTAGDRLDHRRYSESMNQRNAAIHRSWSRGDFADPDLAEKHCDDALEAMLAVRAGRLQRFGLENASIVVVRHEADEFLVRRVGGPLKGHLSRGDRCPANRDLEDALRDYAPYSRHVWISCCGRQVAVAVTADVPIDSAEDELVQIADLYQIQYERLRLFRRTAELQAKSLPAA
ncbi:MAG TPA: hypothetical protein VF729_05080 [Solirubrobacterales bacterium]